MLSFRHPIRRDCVLAFVPFVIPSVTQAWLSDSRLSRFRSFLRSCFLAFLQSCRQDNLLSWMCAVCSSWSTGCMPACLSTFRGKELIKFNRLYSGGSVWRSKAVFGTAIQHNAFVNRALLCTIIFINGFMQSLLTNRRVTGTASSRFSLLHLIRPVGRIFVFNRTRQVVFWGTRNRVSASKQLALPGA